MTNISPVSIAINLDNLVQPKYAPVDLQNCIKKGNSEFATQLVKSGIPVNVKLPNGELPLHFAVRENQPDVVKALLDLGASTELKDFQGLTAVDHAALMQNETMLVNIMSTKIGQDILDIQEQIKSKSTASHVQGLKNKVQQLIKEAKSNDRTLFQQVINNNMPVLAADLTPANANLMKETGDSLLHCAALSGNPELVSLLIKLGANPNAKNSNGETPLHYAAATDNLSVVEALVKNGANPHLVDIEGLSPLALIGSSAYQRDPLALEGTQIVLFSITTLFALGELAIPYAPPLSTEAFTLLAASITALIITKGLIEVTLLYKGTESKLKKVLVVAGALGLAAIPPLNIGYAAWTTYRIASGAFAGLKACWNNAGYRNWAVARNVVVHTTNAADSFKALYAEIKLTYEIYLNVKYFYKMASAQTEEEFFEAYSEWMKFLNGRYGHNEQAHFETQTPSGIDPSTLVGLSVRERLLKKELNPRCVEDALLMVDPAFNMSALRAEGKNLYVKPWKQLLLREVHPDKATGSKEEIQEAAVRLNAAKETLDKWVENNL